MKIQKVEKLVANLRDKNEYAILLINLKLAYNHGLVLKKVNRVIKFNQKAWIKSYIIDESFSEKLWKSKKT